MSLVGLGVLQMWELDIGCNKHQIETLLVLKIMDKLQKLEGEGEGEEVVGLHEEEEFMMLTASQGIYNQLSKVNKFKIPVTSIHPMHQLILFNQCNQVIQDREGVKVSLLEGELFGGHSYNLVGKLSFFVMF